MKTLVVLLREIAGLFIDDGALALSILGTVAVAALAAVIMPDAPLVAGAMLLFGCLGVLLVNVAVASRR